MPLIKALGLARKEQPLAVGARVPQLSAVDPEGNRVDVTELVQQGLTYLYFFPKANTPGCTLQACDLRDHFTPLQEAGIRVIGVSRDKPANQKRFIEQKKLPFLLLSDPEAKVIKAFGVPIVFSLSMRQSYLIRDGVVVWRDLHARVVQQVDDLLRALPNLPAATR